MKASEYRAHLTALSSQVSNLRGSRTPEESKERAEIVRRTLELVEVSAPDRLSASLQTEKRVAIDYAKRYLAEAERPAALAELVAAAREILAAPELAVDRQRLRDALASYDRSLS